MSIRNATYKDAPSIKSLLEGLGYRASNSLLVNQLESMFGTADNQVFVYEVHREVLGFVAVHFLPQLAYDGGLALITYLAVDEAAKDQGIMTALEQHVFDEAWKRRCEKVQVHCSEWRVPSHQFYKQQGYQEYPKYFSKRVVK